MVLTADVVVVAVPLPLVQRIRFDPPLATPVTTALSEILMGDAAKAAIATNSSPPLLARQDVGLSNGPGDPEPCDYAIAAIAEILAVKVPVFGICLGHQLLALACGARTEKMKFGHHGANHPVQDLATGKVIITSQNHGFAVDEASLPPALMATHRSLFDGSLQGIASRDAPAFSFQGHPEASPGPHDIQPLFDRFISSMDAYRAPGCRSVPAKADCSASCRPRR
jgi:carbamoyl-phosphate synthase small subunit